MNGWLAFLITLGFIILIHEWGHFAMARRMGVRVDRFSFGFGPVLWRWQGPQTEYVLSLLPFGGYVKLAGESDEEHDGPCASWEYRSKPLGQRIGIVLAGPLVNYLVGFSLFFAVFWVGIPVYTTQIGHVMEGYPAQVAGLKPGDRIVAVDGQSVATWEEMTRLIQKKTQAIRLTIERGAQRFDETVVPKMTQGRGISRYGRVGQVAVIGVTPSTETRIQRHSVAQAFLKAAHQVWFLTHATLLTLWNVVTGNISLKDSVAGPIGIFHITAWVAQQGWVSLIYLIAVLNTSVGLFNLLPIPVLDGGHLLFLAAEGWRGRPLSLKARELMTRAGLAFLLILLAVVTYNDFMRLGIGQKVHAFLTGG